MRNLKGEERRTQKLDRKIGVDGVNGKLRAGHPGIRARIGVEDVVEASHDRVEGVGGDMYGNAPARHKGHDA